MKTDADMREAIWHQTIHSSYLGRSCQFLLISGVPSNFWLESFTNEKKNLIALKYLWCLSIVAIQLVLMEPSNFTNSDKPCGHSV